MALWKRLWLLFTVIWVVVAGLNVLTIVLFAEEALERDKALTPLLFAIAVPAALYAVGWLWERWKGRKHSR